MVECADLQGQDTRPGLWLLPEKKEADGGAEKAWVPPGMFCLFDKL